MTRRLRLRSRPNPASFSNAGSLPNNFFLFLDISSISCFFLFRFLCFLFVSFSCFLFFFFPFFYFLIFNSSFSPFPLLYFLPCFTYSFFVIFLSFLSLFSSFLFLFSLLFSFFFSHFDARWHLNKCKRSNTVFVYSFGFFVFWNQPPNHTYKVWFWDSTTGPWISFRHIIPPQLCPFVVTSIFSTP